MFSGTLSPDYSLWTKITRFSEQNGSSVVIPELYKFLFNDNYFSGTLSPLFSA
jgi:hypothetical protein